MQMNLENKLELMRKKINKLIRIDWRKEKKLRINNKSIKL